MNSGEPIPKSFRDSVSGANSNFDLQQLQRWLYGAITGSSVTESDDADRIVDSVADQVAPSRALSSEERLEIYQRAYVARLIEVLREEYSVLCRAFGTNLF
ncbi:MAG: putative DNA-binding domain-containing protein, partial [Planctomycetota bacterium]|nr:putative DNA-binding domain-containing protein [Planctomycetota bacterium]